MRCVTSVPDYGLVRNVVYFLIAWEYDYIKKVPSCKGKPFWHKSDSLRVTVENASYLSICPEKVRDKHLMILNICPYLERKDNQIPLIRNFR